MSNIEKVIEEKEELKEGVAEDTLKYSATTYIKTQDLKDFNYYLGTMRKSYGLLIGGILLIAFGGYGLISEPSENVKNNILLCVLGVVSLLFVFVFSKLILKERIKKLDLSDMPAVTIVVSEEGIIYKFENEENNEGHDIIPFAWHLVDRCVELKNHIYIHMVDYRTVLLVIKSDVENTRAYEYLKEKVQAVGKWLEK